MITEEDFAVKLACTNIKLEHPITYGAGPCKILDGPEGVKALAKSASSAVMLGTITYQSRTGNPGNTYYSDENSSFNARGLPNPGVEYCRQHLPEMVEITHQANKALFVSVAGFDECEFAHLSAGMALLGADFVELNLSCPHAHYHGTPRIICFYPDLVEEILRYVSKGLDIFDITANISVKLAYIPDIVLLQEITKVIQDSKIVKAVCAINTLPHALDFDDRGKPLIDAVNLASLGGPAIKSLGLGQVKLLRQFLPEMTIIGCGGINSGKDVLKYLWAGADLVQVTTAFLNEGVKVFDRLLSEFIDEFEKGGKP